MELTTLQENLLSNGILAVIGLAVLTCRDICRRVSHSDCAIDDNKLHFKLPTFRSSRTDRTETSVELQDPGNIV